MKKFLSFIISILFVFLFISCESKSMPSLLGKWEATITLKSEMASSGEDSSTKAYLYTKQNIVFSFSEGGIFTKKILQNVDHVEFVDHAQDTQAAKEYFSKYCDKNLTFDGEFTQKKNAILFMSETVQDGDGEPVPFYEYFAKDPSIGDAEYSLFYEMKDGFLFIDGVKYKKSDD